MTEAPLGPCLLVCAGWDKPEALEAAALAGLEVAAVATRSDVTSGPLHMRRVQRQSGASTAVVFTTDSAGELGPQLYDASLALLPRSCYRLNGADGQLDGLAPSQRRMAVVALPFVAVAALLKALSAAVWAAWGQSKSPVMPTGRPLPGAAVMVVWPVRRERQVGGAITHVSGIMRGFKDSGLRVGLVTRGAPPEQLDGLYDDIEITEAVPKLDRILPYTEMIAANRVVRRAGERLAKRLDPAFVYQRHGAYLVVGSQLSRKLRIPLVLEVNGPVMWTRFNWRDNAPGERLFLRIGKALERRAVDSSAVAAAVSINAANGTLEECGSPGESMLISPNAVDFQAVEKITAGVLRAGGEGRVILGWVGTFGPWHGAANMIDAIAQLPESVSAEMIGAGGEFDACAKRAKDLGVESRVSMPGSLPHADALRRLAGCDILVSPTVAASDLPFFGSPTKQFEFMAIGKPMVSSDLAQAGEILRDGETAVLVPPGDVPALVKAIQAVIAMPDQGSQMGQAARAEAEAEHTWKCRSDAILDALSNRVSGAGR